MPRNPQPHRDDTYEPDDEYEDLEASRTKSSARRGKDEEELDETDIVAEVDLDAAPEGDGPDA